MRDGQRDHPVAAAAADRGQTEVASEQIPWSYGRDQVTAMAVDPDRLFVYWELTDPGIERARAQLGTAGGDASLSLRVYDVTGRIFDGTNAHASFDHQIERDDRQWFFDVGKPASTAVVEVGCRSREGRFVRIARSARADFPRRAVAAAGTVEWLTVRAGAIVRRARGEWVLGHDTSDARSAGADADRGGGASALGIAGNDLLERGWIGGASEWSLGGASERAAETHDRSFGDGDRDRTSRA
jgi:hypothetical protein